jgi:hypothetical protein
MSQPNCQTSECGDRATRLGIKQLEFDLVQLLAQLVNPRVERGQLLLQAWDLGFVVIGSLGETYCFTCESGDLRFMPVALHPNLHLLDVGLDLASLVGQLRTLFVCSPERHASISRSSQDERRASADAFR